MKKRRIIYAIITLIFIALTIFILSKTNLSNNVALSKAIQIILILFLIRISIGCTLYIKEQYEKQKYDYIGVFHGFDIMIWCDFFRCERKNTKNHIRKKKKTLFL